MRGSCAVVLVLGLAGPAFGQGFPFQEGRLSGAAILLRHPGVQAQLKVTKVQNDKVKQATNKVRAKYADEFDKQEKMPDNETRSQFKRNLSQKVIMEVTKELPNILTSDQLKRLNQIALQQSGLQAFDEKTVIDTLKLTKEQQEQIKQVRENTKAEYYKVRQELGTSFEKAKEKEHALQQKSVQMVLATLTEDQRKQWKELHGEPFNFEGAVTHTPTAPSDKKAVPDPQAAEKPKATAPPELVREDLEWVSTRVDEIQPTEDERKTDKIGWASGIRVALDVAKKHNRPVIVHTYNDGCMHTGRS